MREVACPAGQSGRDLQICKEGKFIDSSNTCKPAAGCGAVVFDQNVAPLIKAKCVSCHPGFDKLDTAKSKIDNFIARTSLAPDAPLRMPKVPNPPLSDAEKKIFTDWKAGGLQPNCPDTASNPYISLNDLEVAAQNDLDTLNSGTQTETRWLYTTHKSDEGASLKDLVKFEAAIQKGINSISLGRGIVLAKPVDEKKTLFRFNLNDLKLTVAAWNLIEAADPINLESDTNRGRLLKQLTNSKKPMMSVDAFLTAANKAQVYYAIRKIPSDLNTLLGNLGVNQNVQLANFQALLVGFANSPISLNKNRLLARFDSNDGAYWQTFDTDDIADAHKNLFNFPLLKATNKNNNFKFNASEVIFTLPNGLHGYALFDAAGKRLDLAALNIVAHNVNPPSDPTIKNAQSCYRCHSGGFIPKKDEVRASVDQNASQFDLKDVDLVDLLYRNPDVLFKDDNTEYGASLSKMGILISDQDPISVSLDNLQERQLNAKAVASLFLLDEKSFIDCLGRSADGRAQVGQLLTGGTIVFSQFVASAPVIIRDCRIGVEPLTP